MSKFPSLLLTILESTMYPTATATATAYSLLQVSLPLWGLHCSSAGQEDEVVLHSQVSSSSSPYFLLQCYVQQLLPSPALARGSARSRPGSRMSRPKMRSLLLLQGVYLVAVPLGCSASLPPHSTPAFSTGVLGEHLHPLLLSPRECWENICIHSCFLHVSSGEQT